MQQLISENGTCADCGSMQVTAADVVNGVFLCDMCAVVHEELKFQVKALTVPFMQEELMQLSMLGNTRVNGRLCSVEKPWFPVPKLYPFHTVRKCYARAKYVFLLFADSQQEKDVRRSLDDYWFVLDEVSEETPQLEGPLSRSSLLEKLKDGSTVRLESYVWHPMFGAKWFPIEKTHKSLFLSPDSFSAGEVHSFYETRRSLASKQPPNLRGLLDMQTKGKIVRRWIMLLDASLYISVLTQTVVVENVFSVDELTFDLVEKEGRLGIRTVTPVDEFLLWAQHSEELLEWFTSLKFAKYMRDILGPEDFPHSEVDASEQHVCNVESSASYMGRKILEGMVRKEGSNFKTVKTRWFVLRTQGLYYYKGAEDKSPLGMVPLKDAKLTSLEQYRYPFHFAVESNKKVLHMWASNTSEKEKWMQALLSVIDSRS